MSLEIGKVPRIDGLYSTYNILSKYRCNCSEKTLYFENSEIHQKRSLKFQKKKETWHIWKSCPEIFCPKSWGSDYPLSFIIFYTVPHLHLGFLRFSRARRVAVAASRTRTSPMLFPPTIQRADAASPLLGGGSALQTPGPIPQASPSATGKCGRVRRVFSIFIFFKKYFL